MTDPTGLEGQPGEGPIECDPDFGCVDCGIDICGGGPSDPQGPIVTIVSSSSPTPTTGLPNNGIFATGPGVDYSWLGLLQWAGIISPCGVLCVENWHGPGGLTADYGDAAIVCDGEGSCQNMWWNGSGWDTFENVCFFGTACYGSAVISEAGRLADSDLKSAVLNMAIGDALGGLGAVGADIARGPWDSLLFGRGGGLYGGFLNSDDFLRVGFGWSESAAQNVFRITGDLLNGAHLLNWPWPW